VVVVDKHFLARRQRTTQFKKMLPEVGYLRDRHHLKYGVAGQSVHMLLAMQ